MNEFTRVAVASRTFSLAAIGGMAIAFGDAAVLGGAVVIMGIAAVASYMSYVSTAPTHWIIAVEGTLAGVLVVTGLPNSAILLPYLVVLPLLTGLARGIGGASLVITCQLTSVLGVMIVRSTGTSGDGLPAELLGPWALTIAGSGILGAWAKKAGKSPVGTSANENYDSARRLLGQLRSLARRLPSGLDPLTIASQMLVIAERATGPCQSAVFTRTDGRVFVPLAYRGAGAHEALDAEDELIARVWTTGSRQVEFVAVVGSAALTTVALPLRLGSETVGVLVSRSAVEPMADSIDALERDLDEMSLRLAAALAFDDFRTLVTADERQRLTREIHDGVAQEVASLGYLVDDLTARTNDRNVAAGLKQLRAELSRLVTELRLSIFDLRTDPANGMGLGSALSDYVRKVGARSPMTVHLSLDEGPTRLSPGVETELFRIAQEAITNARKHSQAKNLWVDCWVRPPSALLRIADDGSGMGSSRPDSYGVRIMHERAERIEASLAIENLGGGPTGFGTSVTVSLTRDAASAAEGMRAS